ncbi:MAG: TonB-dependent receptor [Gammaproteobacteria bacterium]|nr:TonB-dependent receptor [Gammaproteobacteria bacterium]
MRYLTFSAFLSQRRCLSVFVCVLSILMSPVSHAGQCRSASAASSNLTELPLEELMQIEITSLGKKPQQLADVAAAAYVISNEDIRRSGVTTIADALQMAPGVHVSKLNAHAWAVSVRGFNGFFANKLLVLIDGRNVYSSTFGGVYWDQQDTLLEDIERIEVIRGPAASIWGANAVNGVINIITRCAKDTQGTYLTAGAGKEDKGFFGIRHGGKVGKDGYMRAYFKAHERDGYADIKTNNDGWRSKQTGFRGDFQLDSNNSIMVSGDLYQLKEDSLNALTSTNVREDVDGGNINARWERKLSDNSHISLQGFIDHTRRKSEIADISVDTFDIDFQHRFGWGIQHEFTWGLGYRHISDDINDRPSIRFNPDSKDFDTTTAFIQNESRFFGDRLTITLGSKFEHNDFTGSEVQPSIRGIWAASDHLSVWASASHAVHTPSRAFRSVISTLPPNPLAPGVTFQAVGTSNLDSEVADVMEFGLRGNVSRDFTWDAALFVADYDDLVDTTTSGILFTPPIPHVEITGKNDARARTSGLELSGNWQVNPVLQLKASYSYLDLDFDSADDPNTEIDTEGRAPKQLWSLRPSFDISEDLQLDFWLKYVDDTSNVITGNIDSYTELDTRLAWQVNKAVEVSLVGQNLLDSKHTEFSADGNNLHTTDVEQNIYLQLRWQIR